MNTIIVDQESLARAVKSLSKVIPTKSIIPVLAMLRIVAKKESLEITANNLDVSMTLEIKAVSDGESSFLVDGGKFAAIVQKISEGEITLTFEEPELTISGQDGFRGSFPTADTSEFPVTTDVDDGSSATLSFASLEAAVNRTSPAVGSNTANPERMGIHFSCVNGKMVIQAADSPSFSRVVAEAQGSTREFILNPVSARVVLACSQGSDVTIRAGEATARFDFPGGHVISKLIAGPYPNMNRILESIQVGGRVRISRRALETAVSQASVMASGVVPRIVVEIGEGLTLRCDNSDLGLKGERSLKAEISGEPLTFAVAFHLLLDALRATWAEEVDVLYGRSPLSPVVVQNAEKAGEPKLDLDRDLFILMPIRLN